jgi:hypothetical protein
MSERLRGIVRPVLADGLALLLIVGLLMLVAFVLAWTNPAFWMHCVEFLDIRGWTAWTWRGVGAALVVVLVIVRFWPGKRTEMTGN